MIKFLKISYFIEKYEIFLYWQINRINCDLSEYHKIDDLVQILHYIFLIVIKADLGK